MDKERALSSQEIQDLLGYDYDLDQAIQLLSRFKAKGESVYLYFNGFKLSLDNVSSPEELRKQYSDYAERLRNAARNPGRYIYEEDDRDI